MLDDLRDPIETARANAVRDRDALDVVIAKCDDLLALLADDDAPSYFPERMPVAAAKKTAPKKAAGRGRFPCTDCDWVGNTASAASQHRKANTPTRPGPGTSSAPNAASGSGRCRPSAATRTLTSAGRRPPPRPPSRRKRATARRCPSGSPR